MGRQARWAMLTTCVCLALTAPNVIGAAPTPFLGAPAAVPGTIQAANFDNGGEGIAYHDSTAGNDGGAYRQTDVDIQASSLGGYNVGWTADTEWLAYTIDVAAAGAYNVSFQVATPLSGGRIHASFGGVDTAAVTTPNTGGWQTWTTVTVPATLNAGQQIMRVVFDVGGVNLAAITITAATPASGSHPAAPAPSARLRPPTGLRLVAHPHTGGNPKAAPTSYAAIVDRLPRPKPALPALGAAGHQFTDPTFSSTMVRVTDGLTRANAINVSYRTPAASPQMAWNATSSLFYVISTDGTVVPYSLDGNSMRASRIAGAGDGGLILNFNSEPAFSSVDPDVIYGVSGGGNNRTISQYNFASNTYSPIVDLDTAVGGLAGTYTGALMTGGSPTEYMAVAFGGVAQDQHRFLAWFPVSNPGARKLLDTAASTLNGAPTSVLLNFKLHAIAIDRNGRWVFLYPTAADLAAPRYASQVYIWDTATDAITAITSGGRDGSPNALPSGHATAGYGYGINHDCCTSTSWDAAQWVLRPLTNPLAPRDLINPVLTPSEVYLSEHPTWNNARPDVLVPFIDATYRYGVNPAPWRAWDDEIIAVETGAPPGASATVWRFAHHRSAIASDTDPAGLYFWYTPRPNVSPNGRWVIFTSNWEKTLGMDPRDGAHREDVFLLQLR